MDLLDFYRAEVLWPYVTGEKDIPRKDDYTEYYRAARDFGRLCALTSLQKASSNPSHRDIDDEFVDIYNGITKAILVTIEMGQNEKTEKVRASMSNLKILADYIGPTSTDVQDYKQGLDVVLSGDIRNVYVADTRVVEEEYRKQVVGYFSKCLLVFCDQYGIDVTRGITNSSSQHRKSNSRSK